MTFQRRKSKKTQASAPSLESKKNDSKQSGQKKTTNGVKQASVGKALSHSKPGGADKFAVPMPKLNSLSSGLGGGGKIKHRASGFDPSGASVGTSDGGGKSASNGSGFDKNTTKKMISSYDISPYVNELRRNIRWNWKAPKNPEGKRVELFLRIAKDGRVVILNVKRTSESGEADNAALNAVRRTMPLNPLPSKYSKSYLDVIFTFDSSANSLGSRF